jgi:tetratricopeptide (TPR) repeat protein
MENNIENLQEKIQTYIAGTMPAQERIIFETQLNADTTLREEVEFYKLMKTTFQIRTETPNIQEMLHDIATKQPLEPDFSIAEKNVYIPKRTFGKWGIPVGIVALLVVGSFFLYQYQQNIQQLAKLTDLAKKMETPMELLIAIPQQPSDAFTLGLQAYEQQNYTLAIQQLQKHLTNQPKDVFAGLYLGISQYFLGENDKVIQTLLPLTAVQEPMNYAVQWYVSLAYLKLGNEKEAIKWLQNLSNTKEYGAQATKLLKEM